MSEKIPLPRVKRLSDVEYSAIYEFFLDESKRKTVCIAYSKDQDFSWAVDFCGNVNYFHSAEEAAVYCEKGGLISSHKTEAMTAKLLSYLQDGVGE